MSSGLARPAGPGALFAVVAAVAIAAYPGHRDSLSRFASAPLRAEAETTVQVPTFSIADVSSAEGSSGRKAFTFTVSLTGALPDVEYRVSYRTADASATGPTVTRTTASPIAIPIIGTATPYPVTLEVSGLTGTIDDVAVRMEDLTHTYPEDLDILLVGPGGQTSMFMSDVGGWDDVANLDLTFRDGAPPPSATHLVPGTYAPTNISREESLPAPAPPGPYPVPLSGFLATNPNGTWSLYIEDDFTTDIGTMAGFSLIFSQSGSGDFIPAEGELIFPPGTTSLPVTVIVKADEVVEPTETFLVNLSSPVNAVLADAQGVGTIFNDDGSGVPIAEDDTYNVPFNTPLAVPAPGVLANDDSNEGGVMTAQLVSGVSNGTLALNPNGGFTYSAAPGYSGPDSFVYRSMTTNGGSNDATVRLAVAVPAAVNDAYTTAGNAPLGIAAPGVLGNDHSNGGGPMTALLVSATTHGSLNFGADGSFVYVPGLDFLGTDTFVYQAVTARGAGNPAAVSIVVVPPASAQAPTGLVVDSVAGNRVTLRFASPLLGPPPAGFLLKGGFQPGEVLAAIPTGSTAPIFTFEAPTGSFYIRMHTIAGGQESAPSNEVPLHVNVPVLSSAPAGLTGLVNGNTVALAWDNTFGGGPPTNVILGVTGDLSLSVPIGLGETFSFADVPPGRYTLRVRGANRAGWGPPSNAVTLTFPGPCSGAPLPPVNFLAYRSGNTIFVVWDPPVAGPAPTSFTLNVTGAYVGSFPTPGRQLSGAAAPGAYKLDVVAQNACGSSAPTPSQTVVVP